MTTTEKTLDLLRRVQHAITYSYFTGDFPPDMEPDLIDFLGPDGGTLQAINAAVKATEALARVDALSPTHKHRALSWGDGDTQYVAYDDLRRALAGLDLERCSKCRHARHDTLGFCPNMASDNDCDCTGDAS